MLLKGTTAATACIIIPFPRNIFLHRNTTFRQRHRFDSVRPSRPPFRWPASIFEIEKDTERRGKWKKKHDDFYTQIPLSAHTKPPPLKTDRHHNSGFYELLCAPLHINARGEGGAREGGSRTEGARFTAGTNRLRSETICLRVGIVLIRGLEGNGRLRLRSRRSASPTASTNS